MPQAKKNESKRVAQLKRLNGNIALLFLQETYIDEGDQEDEARCLLQEAMDKLGKAADLLQASDDAAAEKKVA